VAEKTVEINVVSAEGTNKMCPTTANNEMQDAVISWAHKFEEIAAGNKYQTKYLIGDQLSVLDAIINIWDNEQSNCPEVKANKNFILKIIDCWEDDEFERQVRADEVSESELHKILINTINGDTCDILAKLIELEYVKQWTVLDYLRSDVYWMHNIKYAMDNARRYTGFVITLQPAPMIMLDWNRTIFGQLEASSFRTMLNEKAREALWAAGNVLFNETIMSSATNET